MNERLGAIAARHKQSAYLRQLILRFALWNYPEEAPLALPHRNDTGRRAARHGDMENGRGAPLARSWVSSGGSITNAADRMARKAHSSNFHSRRSLSIKFDKGGGGFPHSPVGERHARPAGQRGVLSAQTGRDVTARTGLFIDGF